MQRTTPEGRYRRKGVTEKWKDPKATVESPNHQIALKRQATEREPKAREKHRDTRRPGRR